MAPADRIVRGAGLGTRPGRLRRAVLRQLAVTVLGLALFTVVSGCSQPSAWIPPALAGWRRPPRPTSTAWAPPKKATAEQKIDMQIAVAHTAEVRGEVDQAIEAYRKALQMDPRRAVVHHHLALLYDRKGDFDKSLACYRQALTLAADDADIHCDLGYSLYLRQRYQEAENSLITALRLRPEFPRAHTNYGLVLARTGREEYALREFAQAGATESQARVNLAFAMLLDNRYPEAAQQLQAASASDVEGLSQERVAQLRRVVEVAQMPPELRRPDQGTVKTAAFR
jgi:Flp pilus assembly protein TadD